MKFSIQKGDRFWKSTPQYRKVIIEVVDLKGSFGELLPCKVIECVRHPVITSNSSIWNVGTTYMLHPDILEAQWERIPSKSDAFKTIYDILNSD